MTRKVVVFYELSATDAEKTQALRRGLAEVALELGDLDVPLAMIESYLEDAYGWAEQADDERKHA